ncbi:type II toxin-antitoxin system Phd/YefM family antitoxin [Poseidonibacter sp.]|uniref:type II toxin-antitoxin system Phd/YefM family antitoxin n=1 Tax=Poseidonibacter sp. TaxID=2321188 RepID=UPI003C709122
MAIIKPISDLRNNFNKISEICHHDGEPVYSTKNGQGDMVVMSMALYEQQQHQLELYQKLLVAEKQSKYSSERKSHKDIMRQLTERVNGK